MASLSAREQAYQTIRSRIITMELKPGDPLNDRELAEQMGISRTPMREALIMLNIAHMVDIKPQSGTHVAPIDLKRMELEQFARFTLEKEILNRVRGRLTDQQEQEYRQVIENYRLLEADLTQPNRETRLLELDNQFHRKAFEITGMEAHFDHMLGELQHVERIRKFSLQTNENKSVCAAHTRILEMVLHGTADELGEALESHLNRYKLSVEQPLGDAFLRSAHMDRGKALRGVSRRADRPRGRSLPREQRFRAVARKMGARPGVPSCAQRTHPRRPPPQSEHGRRLRALRAEDERLSDGTCAHPECGKRYAACAC